MSNNMSNKKKVAHRQQEENQAQRAVKVVFISLVVIALVMIVAFSFLYS